MDTPASFIRWKINNLKRKYWRMYPVDSFIVYLNRGRTLEDYVMSINKFHLKK